MPAKTKPAEPKPEDVEPKNTLEEIEAALGNLAVDLMRHRDKAKNGTAKKQVLNHAFDMADRAYRALRDDL